MKNIKLYAFLCMCVAMFAHVPTADAMKITPPRLVLEPGQKVAHVYVKNDKAKTISYRFRWKGLAMTKDGELVNLDNRDISLVPDYRPASEYIRYSPRRTTLKAGEVQRISFLVRRPPNMPDGEFRSHFVVEAEPDVGGANASSDEMSETAVGVEFLMSRAFPVYLLNGNAQSSVSITRAYLSDAPKGKDQKLVNIDFVKNGNRSVLANIDVLCGDKSVARGGKLIAVYAEADRRSEKLMVSGADARNCRDLKVVAIGHNDDEHAGAMLATANVQK
jgi:hypothetical protein